MKQLVISILVAAVAPVASGQSFDMSQWGAGRGYTEAPYTRYEAEEGRCASYSGNMLQSSDNQTLLQSEASNSRALTLEKPGDYVSWVSDSGDADGLTLRFSVAPGSKARVGVFVADSKLGELSLTADHSWQYCVKIPGRRDYKPEIYSIHTVNPDEFSRMRFDEVHTRLSRAIARGETFSLRLLEGSDATVDFVETEFCRKVEPQSGWAVFNDTTGFNGFSGEVADLYLSSYQNQRYNSPDHSPGTYSSPGKCFNATAGRVTNVWVEHFECGGWLGGASGARFSHCRFRNNYADGINLCSGSANCVVRNCSFRNNGDDDMASWSTGNLAHDNLFDHNTAENNWRASSLGFFGGRNQSATNLAIYDAMENGARVNADFDGTGFAKEGEILLKNISIHRCGTCQGAVGTQGDFWGNSQAGLKISAGYFYDVNNVTLEDIDLYDCRFEGVRIQSGAGKKVVNLTMRNISVNNQGDRGWAFHFFNGLQGNGTGENLTGTGCEEPLISPIPAGFDFNLENGIEDICDDTDPRAIAIAGGCVNADAILSDACGNRLSTLRCGDCIPQLAPGIYLLTAPGLKPLKFAVK